MKKIALVTGGCGGMGRAISRVFAQGHSLVLTDVDANGLHAFQETLREEGYPVADTIVADLSDPDAADEIVARARAAGRLASVVHTAGRSGARDNAEAILRANIVATERLLHALETNLEPGLVAVLIASIAGTFAAPPSPEVEAQCAAPLDPGFVDRILPMLRQLVGPDGDVAGAAYSHTKRAVIRTASVRAAAWARAGARILSLSPGLIDTPMGRAECRTNPASAAFAELTPLGVGRPHDIAAVAAFLCSEAARYMTGTDIKVDGGATSVVLGGRFG